MGPHSVNATLENFGVNSNEAVIIWLTTIFTW